MKLNLNRYFIFLTLLLNLLLLPAAAGQAPDSLSLAVDHLLEAKKSLKKTAAGNIRNDTLSVLQYCKKAKEIRSVDFDSSLYYVKKALDISLRTRSLKMISSVAQDLGGYYISMERFQDALSCFLSSLRIEESVNDNIGMADVYLLLGRTYYYMELFPKSLEYNTKALDIYTRYNNNLGIAKALGQIGSLHCSREFCEKRSEEEKLKDFGTAIEYFEKAMKKYSLSGSEQGIAEVNLDFATVYNKMKREDIAIDYIKKALTYYRRVNDPESVSNALYILGKTYRRMGYYDKSIESFRESESIGKANGMLQGVQFLYEAMATTYAEAKDYREAYRYYIKYMTIRDSVYNSEKSKQFLELEAKYQAEVNQNQILQLMSEKRGRNNLIYMLTGIIVLLGIFIYYHIRLLRQNKVIADQKIEIKENKILELEREKSYLAARSVMEGEEAERSRLAGDLHNGLGGLLSGLKLDLSAMKENSVISRENVGSFNHALSLLDTSISELRRIAHNLMPETLIHYGLKTALEDFCLQVSPAGKPEINVRFFGDEIRYTKELELTMYRIIQELINNSLKHASASLITIQVFSEPQRLVAQVIDNGCGFDTSVSPNARKGKGLENIYNRVTAINGKLDIWSQPGEGTETSIEIEIP